MRALVITKPGGPDVLRVEERPRPTPSGDELLVRVRAAGLNRADLLQRAGHYPPPAGIAPDIPGLEFSGVIEEIGPDVMRFAIGQRVCGLVGGGAQAEFVVTREAAAIPVPDAMTDIEAGGMPEIYITAHDALFTHGSLARGERVLVHAVASGVGIAALQLAKWHGAEVFGTTRSSEKLDRVRKMGLDVGIDTMSGKFDDVVLSQTGQRGVDVIIDFVGAPYFEQNLKVLATRGRLVSVSTLGGADVALSLRMMMSKRLRLVGTTLRGRSYEEKVAASAAMAADALPLFARGEIRVPVDKTFPLAEAAAAHRYLEENRSFGKVVFEV